LKHIFVILALTGILFQNFSKVIILLNFELNQDYIAQNLCVKKNEPNNCCKGKCQLTIKLEQYEKKEQPLPVRNLKENKEIQLFTETENPCQVVQVSTVLKHATLYLEEKSDPHLFTIFHPPTC